jgi:Rieske Fe-S protein
MHRRSFIKICGTAAAMAGLEQRLTRSAQAAELKDFARVKLVDGDGNPLKAALLSDYDAYIFNYPFKGTPCFLINLQTEAARDVALSTQHQEGYKWRGGVGANRSIVAFSAICSHQLAYPARDASAINYVAGKSKLAEEGHIKERGVIVCCAHASVYDPAQGAKVLTGPATQPLATVALEHDKNTDTLYATGVYGGLLFEDFFKAYKKELLAAHGPGVAHEPVSDTAVAVPMAAYTRYQIHC